MLSATFEDGVVSSGSVTTHLRSAIDGDVDPSPPISHIVAEGSDRLLVVSVMIEGNESVSSITYNTAPLTLAQRTDGGGAAESAVEIWYLAAPDVGTFDIVVDFASIASPWAITAANFRGANQLNPIGATAGNFGSLGDVTVDIATSGNSLIFGAAVKDNELATFATGTAEITEQWDTTTGNGVNDFATWGGTLYSATAGTYTLNAADSQSDYDWAIAAIEIRAPQPNPILPDDANDLDMVLVMDVSGSIGPTEYDRLVTGLSAFVTAFDSHTETQFALVAFDSSGVVYFGDFTADGSQIIDAMNSRPDPTSSNATNWDHALYLARTLFPDQNAEVGRDLIPDLIVFASDGGPNARGGHADALNPTGAITSASESEAMQWAAAEADQAKTDGIRIVTVGIGSHLTVNNLVAISGPSQGPPVTKDTDVIVTSDFNQLALDLQALAESLSVPRLTIVNDFSNNDAGGDTPEETAIAGTTGHTFTIVATNNGYLTVDNVNISDVVPAQLTVTNVTGTAGVEVANATLHDNNIQWSVGSLDPGQSVTLTVAYSVGAGVNTQLVTNTASVSSQQVTTPVSDSDDVRVIEIAPLTIKKDFSNNDAGGDTPEETVTAGSTGHTFTIVVTNTGISTADSVIITDVVPAGLKVTNVTGTAGVEVANPALDDNDIRWFLGSLGAGQSVTLTVAYSVGAGVNTQLVTNTARVISQEVTTPVSDSDDVQVTEYAPLSIQKDFSNNDAEGDTPEETVTAGSTGNTFTIVVTNTGISTADNVIITDLVPAGLKVTNVTGTAGVEVANPALDDNGIRWFLGSLGADQSVTLTVTYSVGAGVNTQLVTNTARVISQEVTTPVSDSDDVQVIEDAPLSIQKDFSNNDAEGDTPDETATAGSTGNTFTIVVTNTGISTADNVIITDVVPAALKVTNVTGTAGVQVPNPWWNDNDIRWTLGSLGAGQSVTLTVSYRVGAGVNSQLVNNTARVSSQEVTTPVSDSDDVHVIEHAPLIIQQDFSNNDAEGDTPEETATAGSTGNTFTILVTNTGISTADNLIIIDVVPAQLTVTNVTGTAGVEVANPAFDDNGIRWFLGSLGAGQSVTLTVTYNVGAGVNTQLVHNTARVSSQEVTTPVLDGDDVQLMANAPLAI